MNRLHLYSLKAAIAALAAAFTICAAAATRPEHIRPVRELAAPAVGRDASVDIDAARARVDAARSRDNANPAALEDALYTLGGALLAASQYVPAEAAYAEALRLAEQHGGRESARVLAPLLGLGNALAGAGHHQEAVPHLQRALAIERAQFGLFDLRQLDTLETLAGSLTALNRLPEAQDLMLYRVRAAEKNYGEANPRVIPTLCDLGDWFSENLMSVEARMAFQMALNIVGATPALRDPIIVEPLRGLARTRMRALSYPQSGDGRLVFAKRREFNREGEDALKKAVQIVEADPSAIAPATRIETLIQMGDWYQIEKSPREAVSYYQRAWQLIRTTPGLPESVTHAFDVPLRVYYPTPPIVTHVPGTAPQDTRFHHVQVEFTAAADGSVRDARILDHDTSERYARDILDAVRDSRFRPKFVDGQPVAASGITYREVFWTGKPRD